jgi:hypothetical protein
MCFSTKTPEVPKPPPVPSKTAEDAQRRRAAEAEASRQAQGRAATIITSPLGDPDFGKNVRRTTVGGF